MVDMFTNYENLSADYIPSNLSKAHFKPISYSKLLKTELTKPYELYNAKNELEGYYWYYGDTIELDFSIDGEVLGINGEHTGQYVTAADYLLNKIATLTIYNFRMEAIYTKTSNAAEEISLTIDPELSQKLLRGIYYCSLVVSDFASHETIFSPQDCKFLVK